jgi:hypothetical protein
MSARFVRGGPKLHPAFAADGDTWKTVVDGVELTRTGDAL